jgi:hypothetical protein
MMYCYIIYDVAMIDNVAYMISYTHIYDMIKAYVISYRIL